MDFQLDQVERQIILKMLSDEQKLRYSDQIQDLYDQKLNTINDSEFIEKLVQRNILQQFGFNISDLSIRNYQAIGSYYENDEEIKKAVHYLRINIIKDCPIKENQQYIDTNLMTLDGKATRLSDYHNNDKPLVILAGSIT